MTPVLIGTTADSLGFALAGVTSFVCGSHAEIDSALNRVIKEFEDPVILLSASAAEQIADRCDGWRRTGGGPMFVVLPE
jgi:vacuolar-type H+-ATPase subunit F/Vma7